MTNEYRRTYFLYIFQLWCAPHLDGRSRTILANLAHAGPPTFQCRMSISAGEPYTTTRFCHGVIYWRLIRLSVQRKKRRRGLRRGFDVRQVFSCKQWRWWSISVFFLYLAGLWAKYFFSFPLFSFFYYFFFSLIVTTIVVVMVVVVGRRRGRARRCCGCGLFLFFSLLFSFWLSLLFLTKKLFTTTCQEHMHSLKWIRHTAEEHKKKY